MPERTSRVTWSMTALVVLAACAPYLSTINDYFVQDDFGVVQLMANRPWSTFPRWFSMPWTEDIWGYTPDEIRPFVALTYQLTGKWDPARPELHHLLNIAVHAGNALLVMALARAALALSLPAAAFAAMVFAVLPGQAESVAWITGRVDSMPTFFYLATFLAYVRWRRHRRWSAYAWALVLFFIAVFSKQNTITMVATLAGYDFILLRRQERGALGSVVRGWVPFAVITAGYLLLRRSLFGHPLRQGLQTPAEIIAVQTMLGHHVYRTVIGHLDALSNVDAAAGVLLITGMVAILWREPGALRASFARALLFALLWFAIALAPVALAGYESPRHAYLASVGWVFVLALVFDGVLGVARSRPLRQFAGAAALAVIAIYAARLVPVIRMWEELARISEAGVIRVQQEAAAAPSGTLLIVGLPLKSWEWASPFVLEPPFAPAGLRERVHLITPWRLHCCGTELWNVYTRRELEAWMRASPRPPIIALRFAPNTGIVSRMTDAAFPQLQEIVPMLLQTSTKETLDGVILDLLEKMVAGHPEARQ
jgi:hypothetical protein